MNKLSDLKIIKRHYGEDMAHFCRDYFATILEQDGLLFNIISHSFNPSHNLFKDLNRENLLGEFKNYIYDIYHSSRKEHNKKVLSPKELMSKAGYILYECHNEADIQKFRKYYSKNEELCTFNGGRLETCYVFFAVKKDVNEIRREDYLIPKREDLYGTSVISIQFTKDSNHILSIKNRYNHHVNNPDATFSNNLDNIIPGLTDSFSEYYNLKERFTSNNNLEIPGYIKASNGKYYKYNYKVDSSYYCPDNVFIKDLKVYKYPKDRYILFDNFLLDLEKKELTELTSNNNLYDYFPSMVGKIKNIKIINEGKNKCISIKNINNIITNIIINENNEIIYLKNTCVEYIGANFLMNNRFLKKIELPTIKVIGSNFLKNNNTLEEICLPSIKSIGSDFLKHNQVLSNIKLPSVEKIDRNFLKHNKNLKIIDLPNVIIIGYCFLCENKNLNFINLPKLEVCGDYFLAKNRGLKKLVLPNLKNARSYFLYANHELEEVSLPNLQELPDFCSSKIEKKLMKGRK